MDNYLIKNKQFRETNTVFVDRYEDLKQALDDGKFVMAHRDGTVETEVKIKTEYQCVTRRFGEDLERQNKKPKEHAFGFFKRFFTISG